LRVFVVEAAIQAAVEVASAVRTNLLPAYPALNFDLLGTGVADPHDFIIHPFKGEGKRK
jgi:hypothetical protein